MNDEQEPKADAYIIELTVKRVRDTGEKYPQPELLAQLLYQLDATRAHERFRTAAMIVVLGAIPHTATEI